MRHIDNTPGYQYMGSPCADMRRACKSCGREIVINNNPNITISVNGSDESPSAPRPVLSGYFEVLGNTQTIARGGRVAFDADSADSVGGVAELDETGTIITITRPGLYMVGWNLNLAAGTTAALAGILENGEPASGSASVTGGNFASGTLIHVETVPFTLSLYNFGNEFTIENISPIEDSAASLRVVKIADGPPE